MQRNDHRAVTPEPFFLYPRSRNFEISKPDSSWAAPPNNLPAILQDSRFLDCDSFSVLDCCIIQHKLIMKLTAGSTVSEMTKMSTEERMAGMEHSEVRYFTRSVTKSAI